MIPAAWKEHLASHFAPYFALFFSLFMLFSWNTGTFNGIENKWQDFMFLKAGDYGLLNQGDDRIVIAAIDDDSIRELGWPFPRNKHAELIRKLKKLGAKVVTFDVMFLDPDTRSGAWDKELAAATKEAGNVVHLSVLDILQGEHGSQNILREPIPELKKTARLLAIPNVDRVLDADGHIRRGILFDEKFPYRGGPYPTLDMATLSIFTDTPLADLAARYPPEHWQPMLNSRVPHDWDLHPGRKRREGEAKTIYFAVYRHVSVSDILHGTLSQEERDSLKGAIVLVGSTVLGLFDHYPSPFISSMGGVEIHANDIDNLLHGDHLRMLRDEHGWVIDLLIILLAWLPIVMMRLSPLSGSLLTLSLLVGWLVLNFVAFLRLLRIDFFAPLFALGGSFTVMTVNRIVEEQRQKKFIKGTFGQYLSPKVIDILIKDPAKLKLGGEKRDMSILFLDIAGFTSISEIMTPEGLTEFLNRYLTELSDVILKNEGTIDKYIGDCIMAFWNAPLDLKDHRGYAALSAVQCIQAIERLNATSLPKDFPPDKRPEIRVGLNAGFAVVGNMGSTQRLSYTVIGDEVNLASRLEGANKFFHSHIMASESVMEGARDFVEARELGRVRVVGKKIPIKVFELLGKKGELDGEWTKFLKSYVAGIEAYGARKFEDGEKLFGECAKLRPNDGPAALYLRTCRDFSVIPPPDDWDGVWNLTAK